MAKLRIFVAEVAGQMKRFNLRFRKCIVFFLWAFKVQLIKYSSTLCASDLVYATHLWLSVADSMFLTSNLIYYFLR